MSKIRFALMFLCINLGLATYRFRNILPLEDFGALCIHMIFIVACIGVISRQLKNLPEIPEQKKRNSKNKG